MDLLVVAAFPPELAAMRARLGDAMRGTVGARTVGAEAVGVGMVEAAAGAAARIATLRPKACVMVGTCGVYAPPPLVRSVIAARRICLVEPAAIEARGAIPEPMPVSCEADDAMTEGLVAAGATPADVATTIAITTDDALAASIAAASRCAVEHLESFAVARACAQRGIPFAAALGVANVVGANARDEWRANHQAAGDAAVAVLLAWLEGA